MEECMASLPTNTYLQKIWNSFNASIGDIVFGMEDGTVSIFGLVFGVAASSNSSAPVLLAGATGAAAAAVSMMAGAYLDVQSTRGIAQAQLAHEKAEIEQHPEEEYEEIAGRLRRAGFTESDAQSVLEMMKRTPDALLKFETAFELQLGNAAEENAIVHALWMFLADLFAASIPVIPFALFSLNTARIVSVIITTLLLILLGIGRALVAHQKMLITVLETVGIATAAAVAGVFIGKLIGG
jgi:predicted membrane protein (TIGR00267 family)